MKRATTACLLSLLMVLTACDETGLDDHRLEDAGIDDVGDANLSIDDAEGEDDVSGEEDANGEDNKEDDLCKGIECGSDESCYRGVCYPHCDEDAPCGAEDRCYQGHCAPLDCDGVQCGQGENCHRGVCYDYCFDDAECGDERSCEDNVCVAKCDLPWGGGSIVHGDSVTAYQHSEVACGASCPSETRTCDDAILSGSYTHPGCAAQCAGCPTQTLNWGEHNCQASFSAADHDGSRTASNTRSGRNGSATYSCYNGNWLYMSSTCTPSSCSLPWGGSISHGQSVTAYQTSTVSCNTSCNSESRTCSYGSLSGSYSAGSCSESCADCSATSVSWWGANWHGGQSQCNGSLPSGVHQQVERVILDSGDGFEGEVEYLCDDGSWVQTDFSATCTHY